MKKQFITTETNKYYLGEELNECIICSSNNDDELFYYIAKNDFENQKNNGFMHCWAIKEVNGNLHKWITDIEVIENEEQLEQIDGTDDYMIIKEATFKKAKGPAYKVIKPVGQVKVYDIQTEE